MASIQTVLNAGGPAAGRSVINDNFTAINDEVNTHDGEITTLQTQVSAKANTASPTFTGTPAAPTASNGTNTTQIATTAFVQSAVSQAGGGNVSNTGTPVSGQAAVWTGANNIQGVAYTGTGSPVAATSPTLVTPALGTPSALVLTNATGLPLTTGVTGALPVANGGTGATATTGTGNNVLSTSPTLVTPALGTPSAVVLTNATGLPLSTGVTGNLGVSHLNSGTSASSSTFWRGDGTWATPAGGGAVPAKASFIFSGGDTTPTAGTSSNVNPQPAAWTITGYTIIGDVSGSAVVDILMATGGSGTFTSITASAKPTLTSQRRVNSTTLTGWTTTVPAGADIYATLSSVSTLNNVTVVIYGTYN